MNFQRLFLLVAMAFISVAALAQNKTVTGKVTDSAGAAVPGASVLAKGTNIGTQTGTDGSFSLSVPQSVRTLVISSLGFATKEVAVGAGAVNVTLESDISSSGDDVVVVAYGTARKKDLTGSVSTVTAKDFQKGVIGSPEQMISGKVPGVSIISGGGQPGGGSQIRIRGGSSLNASNDPLIVVDGVPLSGDGIGGSPNPLSLINPNDIESFTVLRDASAAAIYGTRAANGVILITTKKGKGGALKVNFTTVQSIATVANKVDVLSANQVRDIVNNSGNAMLIGQLGTANTDWQDEIYRSAFATDNNITLSGGIKNLPYRLSLGYQNIDGVLKTDNYQRTSVGLNLNPSFLKDHLKIDLNLKGSFQDVRYANQGAIGAAVSFDPTQPVYSGNSRYGGYFQWTDPSTPTGLKLNAGRNPVALLEQTDNQWKPFRSIGNIQFDYKFHFLPELRANLNLAYDIVRSKGNTVVSDTAFSNNPDPNTAYIESAKGSRTQGKLEMNNEVLEFYLNYAKDIKSIKSRIDVTGGYSYNFFETVNHNYQGAYLNGDTIIGRTPIVFATSKEEHSLISVFGRLNYTLADKYLLTATVRRDGSSRFAKDNKWGTFPSVALAWRINQESFLKNVDAINDLKLRVGYGVTGQQDGIGNYNFLPVYDYVNNNPFYYFGGVRTGYYSPRGYNGALKWEETSTYNVALDFSLLDNRINGSIDVYKKKTKDLLNFVPQPTGTNFDLYVTTNVGDMENKGVEFNLNVQPVRKQNLVWDVNFNMTYNKNEITRLTVNPDDKTYEGLPGARPGAANTAVMISSVGGPKNTFYVFKQVYAANGTPIEGLFEDLNRDGVLNLADRYRTKSADPNLFFGFSTNVNYKKWNAGFVLRANFNNYLFNDNAASRGRGIDVLGNYTVGNANASYLDTRISGTINKDYQPLSDLYLENASFLKMDNLNISYNVGKVFRDKVGLRLNAFVQNVFTITKYTGLDPESTFGLDANLYPRPRTFSIGANLDF